MYLYIALVVFFILYLAARVLLAAAGRRRHVTTYLDNPIYHPPYDDLWS